MESRAAMDKLESIFELQRMLDGQIIEKRGLSGITPEEWMQKKALALMCELSEVVTEIQYKWWKNPVPVDNGKVKEELVDVLHFFTSMCLTMDMTADELFSMYMEKNEENIKRQNGLSAKKGYAADGAGK